MAICVQINPSTLKVPYVAANNKVQTVVCGEVIPGDFCIYCAGETTPATVTGTFSGITACTNCQGYAGYYYQVSFLIDPNTTYNCAQHASLPCRWEYTTSSDYVREHKYSDSSCTNLVSTTDSRIQIRFMARFGSVTCRMSCIDTTYWWFLFGATYTPTSGCATKSSVANVFPCIASGWRAEGGSVDVTES